LSIDAPEYPLPTCYHDCWAAIQWVSSHSNNTLNNAEPWLIDHGDFSKIFIGGDSAGANIAHNMAIKAGIFLFFYFFFYEIKRRA
jgi:acetyl esterase/lipase